MAFIILAPFSALLSQLIGTHKKMKANRVWFTVITILLCPIAAVLLFLTFPQFRATALLSFLIVAVLYNIFAVWIQREKPLQNTMRKWVNLAIVLCGFIWALCFTYNLYNDYEAPAVVEEADGWTDLGAYYSPHDFELDFGFSIPAFETISRKRWRKSGASGDVIEIKTKEAVTKQFLCELANKNREECSYNNGVFTYSFVDPMHGNLHVYKITHNDDHSLTITLDHPR